MKGKGNELTGGEIELKEAEMSKRDVLDAEAGGEPLKTRGVLSLFYLLRGR